MEVNISASTKQNILNRLRGLALTSGDHRSLDIDWKIQESFASKIQKRTLFFVLVAEILNSLTYSLPMFWSLFLFFFTLPFISARFLLNFRFNARFWQQILEVGIARWIATRASTIKHPDKPLEENYRFVSVKVFLDERRKRLSESWSPSERT